jgi:hypothetical protein
MSRPALGPTQLTVQWVPGLSRGVESGRGVTLTTHPLLVLRSKNRVLVLQCCSRGARTFLKMENFAVGRRRPSGPRSSVGIATRCGLDGLGIESRWGRDFLHMSRPVLGPTQPPVKWVPGFSPGLKRPGRDSDPSSAEV